jgi:sulfonate transport system substrate-binding protein
MASRTSTARVGGRTRSVRISLLTLAGVLVVLPLSSTAEAGAATKENDHGVVIRFEGSQGTSLPELAITDGSMAKALGPLGASASVVGNFTAEAPAVQAINADSLDIAGGSITATAGALAGNADIKLFAYYPEDGKGEAIVVKNGSPIKSVKDLEGKTIAVNQAGSGQYIVDQALSYHHVPISSVHFVYLLAPAGNAAFQAGSVDAWGTFATFIPLAEANDDAHVLVWGYQVASANDGVDVVRTAFAQKYPHLLKVVLGVIQAEARKEIKDPKAYNAALDAADHLTPSLLKFEDSQQVVWQPVTKAAQVREQKVATFFYKAGAIPSPVDIAANTVDLSKVH